MKSKVSSCRDAIFLPSDQASTEISKTPVGAETFQVDELVDSPLKKYFNWALEYFGFILVLISILAVLLSDE